MSIPASDSSSENSGSADRSCDARLIGNWFHHRPVSRLCRFSARIHLKVGVKIYVQLDGTTPLHTQQCTTQLPKAIDGVLRKYLPLPAIILQQKTEIFEMNDLCFKVRWVFCITTLWTTGGHKVSKYWSTFLCCLALGMFDSNYSTCISEPTCEIPFMLCGSSGRSSSLQVVQKIEQQAVMWRQWTAVPHHIVGKETSRANHATGTWRKMGAATHSEDEKQYAK